MAKFIFFGVGAVGTVMSTCLEELYSKYGIEEVEFLFIVRNKEKAQDFLFRSPDVLSKSKFIEVNSFEEIDLNFSTYEEVFANTDVCINSSIPDLNEFVQKFALRISANYVDLASDMYNEQTQSSLKFIQQKYNDEYKRKNIFSLINLGISPGVTNFLIGEKLCVLEDLPYFEKIAGLELYLLEDIESEQVVFSWSPQVALEELKQKPRFFSHGELHMLEPFSSSTSYFFPGNNRHTSQYPLYQEEVLSLHDTYPNIPEIKVFTGGSEVELVKNLFQLNLLSEQNITIDSGATVESIVLDVIPGLQSPRKIESLIENNIIKSAQFCAIAEIKIEVGLDNNSNKKYIIEKVGLNYDSYTNLSGTKYSGSTYISYPTGVGAAILLFYSLIGWKRSKPEFSGVIKAEELSSKLGLSLTDWIKRELAMFEIDLISSIELDK